MQCIARRACPDKHNFKLFKEENGIVKEARQIWTEFRCPNMASDKTLCSGCTNKPFRDKYQALADFDHGLVGGPYTKQSKLYGSDYYLKCIKSGWKIREADEQRAKEAQQKSSMQAEASALKQPKRRLTIKKGSKPEASKGEPENQLTAEFVESKTQPIVIENIVVVKVKKIRTGDSDYYYDEKSGKVYGVSTKGVGPYKGRYSCKTDTVDVSYPDSDVEA